MSAERSQLSCSFTEKFLYGDGINNNSVLHHSAIPPPHFCSYFFESYYSPRVSSSLPRCPDLTEYAVFNFEI